MNPNAEFDVIVYGASGFTGRLVAEYLAQHKSGSGIKWAMAGRNGDKLAAVRDEIGAPQDTPLVVADADDPASIRAMAKRAKCVLTTVGPYQLYGSDLVAACAETGSDYVDLSGEPGWMHAMIDKHGDKAQQTGARIVFSCGFDSIPFDLGVQFVQRAAVERQGAASARVRCRVESMAGGFSGGTAASLQATMAALQKDPELFALLLNPFALADGFQGPQQPEDSKVYEDEASGQWVAPFIMAPINTKNVHRSNALLGYPYGEDFLYDEMMLAGAGDEGKAAAEFMASVNPIGEGAPKPGEGPSKEERDAGHYSLLFLAEGKDGQTVRARVTGNLDPGYGSTSRMITESALCLTTDCPDLAGGIYTPAAAMGSKLVARLTTQAAGLTFELLD